MGGTDEQLQWAGVPRVLPVIVVHLKGDNPEQESTDDTPDLDRPEGSVQD